MKKNIVLIFFFMLASYPLYAAENPDKSSGAETGISINKGKTHIKDEEIYPYLIIEQNPPLAAVRGYIFGNVKEDSLKTAMTGLSAEYNLAGWIRKTPEGSFQFHLEGDPEKLKEAVAKIPTCDRESKIEKVESKTAVPTKYIKGFKIIGNEDRQGD
jgi:acylphosphatase